MSTSTTTRTSSLIALLRPARWLIVPLVLACVAGTPAAHAGFPLQVDGDNVEVLLSRRFDDGTLVIAARWKGNMGQPLLGQFSNPGAFFIAAYSPAGELIGQPTIVRPALGISTVSLRSLEVETDGLDKMIYVGGEFRGDVSFGSTLLSTANTATCGSYRFDQEVYVAKLNLTSGGWQWARRFGSVVCPGGAGNGFNPPAPDPSHNPRIPSGSDDLFGGLTLGTGGDQFVYLAVTSKSSYHARAFIDEPSPFADFRTHESGIVLARTPKMRETDPGFPSQYQPGQTTAPDDIYAIRGIWHTNANAGFGPGDNRWGWAWFANDLVYDNGQIWLLASWWDPFNQQHQDGKPWTNPALQQEEMTLFRIIVPGAPSETGRTEVNIHYNQSPDQPSPSTNNWGGSFPTYTQRIQQFAHGLEIERDRVGNLVISGIAACGTGTTTLDNDNFIINYSTCAADYVEHTEVNTRNTRAPGRSPLDLKATPRAYVLVARDAGISPTFIGKQVDFVWGYETTDNWWKKRTTAIEADGNGSVYYAEMDCVGTDADDSSDGTNANRCAGGTPRTGRVHRIRRNGTTTTAELVWTANVAAGDQNEFDMSLRTSPYNSRRLRMDSSIEFRETPLTIDGAGNPQGSTQIFFGGNTVPNASIAFGTESVISPPGMKSGFLSVLDSAGNWLRYYQVQLGAEVPRPNGAAASQPSFAVDGLPEAEANQAFYWDAASSRLYAVRPGAARVLWTSSQTGDPPLTQGVNVVLPSTPQYHAVGAPTRLTSSNTSSTFQQIHYSENQLSSVGNGVFNRSQPGWSVLRYAGPSSEVRFDVVQSVDARASQLGFTLVSDCTIGTPLTFGSHTDDAGYTGWAVDEIGIFDATAPYDRATRAGQLVAVNSGTLDAVWSTRSSSSGVAWPDTSRRHACVWPAAGPEIKVDDGIGSGPITFGNPQIYAQADRNQPGFNPNDEHALLAPATPTSSQLAVFALRHEGTTASMPYVILKYRTNVTDPWTYQVYRVGTDASAPFSRAVQVGNQLVSPYPLPVVGDCTETFGQGVPYWEDVRGRPFARSSGPASVYFYYPLLAGFWWDPNNTGSNTGAVGDCVAYRRNPSTNEVLAFTYNASWPNNLPVLRIGDRLFDPKAGLPDLRNQAAAEVIFEGNIPATPATASAEFAKTSLVRLTDPLTERSIPVAVGFSLSSFTGSPYEIRVRLVHDAVANRLGFKGYYDGSLLGEPLLLPNVMLPWERDALKSAAGCDSACDGYVDALFALTNNPNGAGGTNPIGSSVWVGLEPAGAGASRADRLLGLEAMLTAGGARGEGRVTLAFNNDTSLDAVALPTTLVALTVACSTGGAPYLGTLHQMPTDNVFEQRLVLRHSSDHGFEPERSTFNWYLTESSVPPTAPPATSSDNPSASWLPVSTTQGGGTRYVIEGQNKQTIVDNDLIMKWATPTAAGCTAEHRWVGDPGSTPADTAPKLAEGWIKRVVRNLNPFKARVLDFHSGPAATYASMVQQAGEPYAGPVTFNGNPANLNSLGLIESYETILRSGRQLTIDSADPISQSSAAGHDALLLASTRIAELYTLLANEAITDAADPTIGFSSQSNTYGTLAPAIFAFQNQVPSLLEEELGLLRGRDPSGGAVNLFPVFNRFVWNFTSGEGEVAYSQVYNLEDETDDGLITEADARVAFPQGHGDAWGHLLTAQKRWYDLLRHPNYVWRARAEKVNVAGTAITVDYRDERKFAEVAAAKAKAGAEIVNLTYRKEYVEDANGQFQGYTDPDASRAWGVDEWARRAAQGSYFDWAVANALLPDAWEQQERTCALFDPTTGLPGDDDECPVITSGSTVPDVGKIDRTNVPELAEIAEQFRDVHRRIDEADLGLNPLGLAKGVVPFDIDPSLIDQGQTHFEQVYERAVDALENAVSVFDHAASLTQNLRRNQDSLSNFQNNVEDQERDYRNRLIELYGYPYADDIGPGKTYPAGYDGPDLYHYMYVDDVGVTGMRPERRESITAYYSPINGIDEFYPASNAAEPPLGTQLEVLYEYESGGAGLIKPASWIGTRRAPGLLQERLSDVRQAEIQYQRALREYDNLIVDIAALRDDIARQNQFAADSLQIIDRNINGQRSLNEKIESAQRTVLALRGTADFVEGIGSAVAEGLPKVIGLSNDATSGPRAVILTAARIAGHTLNVAASAVEGEALGYESAKESIDLAASRDLEALGFTQELENMKGDLEAMLRQEPLKHLEVLNQQEVAQQAVGRYAASLAEALRLLDELAAFRRRTAGDVQQYRYEDMTFRIARNDAIQKYRAQFDLAARYAYLAATAYDYETNLLGSSSGSGQQFLTDIVRHRTLGQIQNGFPQAGSRGLADPLARMKLNFDVLKGQMGFNNPQTETNRFSLRRELLRLRDASDEVWEAELRKYLVDDLWELPEFRRFARPFAPEAAGPQPALVIGLTAQGGRELSTTVSSGLNFFGHELGGGDSTYDPTNFVTKIRSVGVWFTNYNASGLSNTPRVYLIPVGADVLRAPAANDFGSREWRVIDQALPVPFPIGPTSLSDPDYIPANAMSDSFATVRRFSRFRAYHDSGGFNPAETTTDSRLIGRSVWNTRWLLIIPGETLLADPDVGLETFIEDVDDIQMFFQTYAFSGN